MISVIIPTYNRADLLAVALESILQQSLSANNYEIIVVDNNSTDNTQKVVSEINQKNGNRIISVFEENPGLVNGRHRGAKEAKGDILVFGDDDIIVSPGWLTAINQAFNDPKVALVGGKVIPDYEIEPPEWINEFWSKTELGSWIFYLSLIDLGDEVGEIPANYVFGCNFSIRKSVLYECGGFHPDSFPPQLIKYRGDGEYGLALEIMKRGYKTIYHPQARVKHQVTKERMTANYFCRRSFYEGISNSYTEIRQRGGVSGDKQDSDRIRYTQEFAEALLKGVLQFQSNSLLEIKRMVNWCYEQGKLYHHDCASADNNLLTYVLKKDYYAFNVLTKENKMSSSKLVSQQPIYLMYLNKNAPAILAEQAQLLLKDAQKLFGECRYQEALVKIDKAMYMEPRILGLQYMRGVCLLNVGRVAEAEIAIRAELKVQPRFAPALKLLEQLPSAYGLEKILAVPTKVTFSERMLLYKLAQKVPQGGVIVELGSYVGASTSFLAEGSKQKSVQLFCIDTWENDAMPENKRDTWNEFKANTKDYQDMLIPLRGLSVEVASDFSKKIDLLFIDADHSYQGCSEDVKAWLSKVKDGGTIVFHDYGWAEGVQRTVAELIMPIQSMPGQRTDSIYWTMVNQTTKHTKNSPLENARQHFAEAEEICLTMFQREPNEVEVWGFMGEMAEQNGELDEAIACYRQVIVHQPDNAEAYYNLGNACQQQGKIEEAIDFYLKATLYRSDYAEAHYNLGMAFQKQGKISEAISSYYQALTFKPDYAETLAPILPKLQKALFDTRVRDIYSEKDTEASWVDDAQVHPISAVVYITELCNSRCVTCNFWKVKKEDRLSTETWLNILAQMRQIGISSVEFVGGEPLLRPDLPELIKEAKKLKFSTILLSSNAFLLDSDRIDEMIEYGVNNFHISLDGMEENYHQIRGVDWFDRVVSAIGKIAEKGFPVLVLTTLVKQNIDELEQIVELVNRLGAYWSVNILENQKYGFKGIEMNPLQIVEPEEIDRTIATLKKIRQQYPRTCYLQETDIQYIKDYLEDSEREKKVPCSIGFRDIYLDPKANLYSACMSMRPVGNLTETPLKTLITSEVMRSRLKDMLLRNCSGCTCGYSQRAALMNS